ncbi:MAG: IclR family transcriptional regulator [Dermatophilaceae bacterium]
MDRGLVVLRAVAGAGTPVTVSELCEQVGLHRSIVYRLLRTLEDHRLVARTPADSWEPGVGLVDMASGVAGDLRSVATAELGPLADQLAMTAFVVIQDGAEAVTLLSVEPDRSRAHVTYAPGTRHPVGRGAPGLALLAAAPARPGERAEVGRTRRRGWVRTTGEVLPGLSAIAVPLPRPGRAAAAVAVVFAGTVDEADVGRRVVEAAGRIAGRLS